MVIVCGGGECYEIVDGKKIPWEAARSEEDGLLPLPATTPLFWVCECEDNYLHHPSDRICGQCGDACQYDGGAPVSEVAELLGVSEKPILEYGDLWREVYLQGNREPQKLVRITILESYLMGSWYFFLLKGG